MRKIMIINNRGSMTVETTLVIPIVLFAIYLVILLFVTFTSSGQDYGRCYSMIYSYNNRSAQNEFMIKEQKNSIIIDYNENHYETEENVCTDRLRRWQLYGDVLSE